ncbi:large ribosomal subunit protein uL10-like [Nicotiana sylvestris]|uniref:large ribosomal subunit protein uL10-like n=1 Tax=Nicotiana sylvestris TaxID=4096 RepID=UPI00388CA7B8
MAPFEALYGQRCRSPIEWFEPAEAKLYGTDLVKDTLEKGIMRFMKKCKLSPGFIGPFEVLRRVEEVAHELALPPSLSGVHPVFHVFMLQRYHADLSHVLDFSTIQLDESLGYEEEPVAIVARQVRQLRSKRISANVLAIVVETDYSFPLADKVKEYLEDPSKFVVVAAAPVAAASFGVVPAAAKEEEKDGPTEQSDDDAGFSLFD